MLKFLLKGVFRDRHRYLFPLIIVSSGITMVVFMLALMQGYSDSFIRENAGLETGHLKVVTKAYAEMMNQKPYPLGLLDIEGELQKWKKEYPQLDWVERIYFGALLDVPDKNGETREQGDVIGFGIDILSSETDRRMFHLDRSLASGRLPQKQRELLISDLALKKLGLALGDSVTLIGSDVLGSLTMANFRISGTVNFGVEAMDRGAVIADVSDIRTMLDMEGGAGEILAYLRTGVYDKQQVEAIRDSFNSRYEMDGDDYSPVMLAMSDQNDLGYIMGMLESVSTMLSTIFILILGIVLWNSGLMNGIRRYGEFGIRLAVGESKMHLYKSLLIESLIIGVVGSTIGILLGLGISLYFNQFGMDVSAFGRNSTLLTEDVIYTRLDLQTALAGYIPGILSTVLGAALAGIAIFKRQTAQLSKELES